MIDHISIGVKDLARASRFYDAALATLRYDRQHTSDGMCGYGDERRTAFWLNLAKRPVPPDPDSGLHICFLAPDRASVDAFHAAALANGGKDNGKPGLRPDYSDGYYAAFAIDPDGYRIEAYVEV